MSRKLPAMSLIELLVVILITAVILTLGISSLIGLRNRLTVRNAAGEFILNVNSVRNDARNGVIPGKQTNYGSQGSASVSDKENIRTAEELDFYVVGLKSNTYYRGICDQTGINTLSCTFNSQSLKGAIYDVVEVKSQLNGTESANCAAIVMSLTTGKFRFGNLTGDTVTMNNTAECQYQFVHSATRAVTTNVKINSNKSEIKQE